MLPLPRFLEAPFHVSWIGTHCFETVNFSYWLHEHLYCRHISIVGWGRDWWLSLYVPPPPHQSQVQGNQNGKTNKQKTKQNSLQLLLNVILSWQVERKPGGRGREWATLGVHPLSWLLSNNRLEKVPFVSVPHTYSNRLLLSNQDKGCTPSVVHSLALPLGPALLNLWNVYMYMYREHQNLISRTVCKDVIRLNSNCSYISSHVLGGSERLNASTYRQC